MGFDVNQLQDIRDRIKVSEVVGARFKLLRKGAEFVVEKNESFTVNDKKQFWCEFGAGGDGKPHDIFDFLQQYEGFSFREAVEELAQRAGVTVTNGSGRSGSSSNGARAARPSGNGAARGGEASPPAGREDRPDDGVAGTSGVRGRKEVVAEWDYRDAENNLLYQVVRMQERMPDGSWREKLGKPWKTFMQRRPDGEGGWILGLDVIDRDSGEPLEFVKGRNSTAWMRATEERKEWPGVTLRTFPELGNVDHWLYNANAVIDELQEPKEDQRPIFIPEGEGKVDVLKEWGLLAVTNSSGAKHFSQACAEFFRGARQVVILQDNDRAGSERVAKLAPMLKAIGVESVQSLNFRDFWNACPVKGDIKDWRDKGGGTKDALLDIVENLKEWTPEPYKSKFGARTSLDLGLKAQAYPWRIKGILPMLDNVLIMGPSRSGKTFETLDMIMHVHNGQQFAGRKVIPGGYIYLTYEGATGFENRLRAYLKHHEMTVADLHSFAWLTAPPNLFSSEENIAALIEEIKAIAAGFTLPLAGIVIDTHNSATRGSSEIKSDDMNKIMQNYDTIKDATGAPLLVIGHTNAEGRHRGNEQFFNNIETAILIERVYTDAKKTIEKRDDDGVAVRRGRIVKQREGDDRTTWDFVLHKVVIGEDEDGEPIDSMVSVEPAQHVPDQVVEEHRAGERPAGFYLKGHDVDVFRALLKAIETVGAPPKPELGLPSSVTRVISWAELGIEYKKTDPQEEDESTEKYRTRLKTRVRRFRENLLKYNVIGIASIPDPRAPDDGEKPRMIHYVWPTGRQVYGKGLQWPPVPKKKESKPLVAPGEDAGTLGKDLF